VRLDSPEGFASYGEVQQWLEAQSGEMIPYKTVHKTVRYRLGAKLKAPHPQNIKQDPDAVETYKKIGSALKVFGHYFGLGQPLRYLCQDEMRIGLMSQRGRVITSRGVKPIAKEQYVRENVWI
jgi:hypothetical protein